MIKKLLQMFRQLFISLLVKEVIRLGQPHLNVWVSAMKCFLITIPRWSRWTCFLPTLPSFSVPWWPSIMVDWRGPNKRIHEKNAVFIADDITVIYVTISTQLSSFFFFFPRAKTNPSEFTESVLCIYSHWDAAQHTKTNTTHRHISYQGNTN